MSKAYQISRPCDMKICLICKDIIKIHEDGMRVPIPSKQLLKLSINTKSKFCIQWENLQKKIEYFHCTCWDSVYKKESSIHRIELRILSSIFDSIETYQAQQSIMNDIKSIAELFRTTAIANKHVICFSGAGISVSSGIPTYRGALGIDTLEEITTTATTTIGTTIDSSSSLIIETKKRKLNKNDNDTNSSTKIEDIEENGDDIEEDIDYTNLIPTFSHDCLRLLYEKNMMHYCITQNCDDLHAKAGFPRDRVIELHGNVFIETCEQCEKEYIRDYCVDLYSTSCENEKWFVRCKQCGWNHYTGRYCNKVKGCKGKLKDTIINFGDDLNENNLLQATIQSSNAEICLCVGTSLTVTPASTLPRNAKHLIIINPMNTYLDDIATYRLKMNSDTFFTLLFEQLQFENQVLL